MRDELALCSLFVHLLEPDVGLMPEGEDTSLAAVVLFVEVLTGTAVDDFGNVTALSAEEWQSKRAAYVEVAEKHLARCRYPEVNLYRRQKAVWEGGGRRRQ